MLTKDDFEYLLDKQNQLDENIRNTKGISEEEWTSKDFEVKHAIALRTEIGEFVNEIKEKEVFKYWADKTTNLDKLLDEAIDVLHFILLFSNKKDGVTAEYLSKSSKALIESDEPETSEFLAHMLVIDRYDEILGCLIAILDRYGFTRQDILDQYHTKNKENFRRLQSGY